MPQLAPYQFIRFGEMRFSSLSEMPQTLAAAGNNPANLTIRFGSNNPAVPVEVISLSAFDNGVTDDVANETFVPNGGLAPSSARTDDPTITLFNGETPVARGVWQSLNLDIHRDGRAYSEGSFFVFQQALGNNPTIFNEIMAKTGNSGIVRMTSDSLRPGGSPTGFADAELFTSSGRGEFRTLDTTNPTADIVNVTPDPRNTTAGWITINFSEVVTGLDPSDLVLTRNGTPVSLSGIAYGSTSSTDVFGRSFNLSTQTAVPGSYLLRLRAAGSGIRDQAGNPLLLDVTDEWVMERVLPAATSFARQTPAANPTNADALVFRATFSEAVTRVDEADFVVHGTTAIINTVRAVNGSNGTQYDIGISGGNLGNLNGTVGINLATSQNIIDTAGNSLPNFEPAIDQTYSLDNSAVELDFGDAPDAGSGTGFRNYQTLLADNGPRHIINATQTGLFLGTRVDGETNATPGISANGDDLAAVPSETGVFDPASDLVLTAGTSPVVRLHATNTTAQAATLYGWIDVNQDGLFDNATERTATVVPAGTTNGTFRLRFRTIPATSPTGTTYARFRLSSDGAAGSAVGVATGGEVEDYAATVLLGDEGGIDTDKTQKIAHLANGGPALTGTQTFGSAVVSLGDLDGDGIAELAVGENGDDTGGTDTGAVHVLFLNANGTAKRSVKIANATNGGPVLTAGDWFGCSIALMGDLNGDGIPDLAVGAKGRDTPRSYYQSNVNAGGAYLLLMNSNGTVKTSIQVNTGNLPLAPSDNFGTSLAPLGDLDGNGVIDLAVGAIGKDQGTSRPFAERGAVFVVFLNANGTIKNHILIGDSSGGHGEIADLDYFGSSLAALGDIDGDGFTDLAIGAVGNDTGGDSRGAVHVVLLKADGRVKSTTRIASGTNGGPTLANGDRFGTSLAALGDRDGDGITELAVGAAYDDANGASTANRGAVHILHLYSDGAVRDKVKIPAQSGGAPALQNGDRFGTSIAPLGDLDGDGRLDFVVGSTGDDTGINDGGAVNVLFFAPPSPPPVVTLSIREANTTERFGSVTVTATLSAPSRHNTHIDLAFSGTATKFSDYTPSADAITIPAGSTSGSMTLSFKGDSIPEVYESILIDISSIENGVELETQQVQTTIADGNTTTKVSVVLEWPTQSKKVVVSSSNGSLEVRIDGVVDTRYTMPTDYLREFELYGNFSDNTIDLSPMLFSTFPEMRSIVIFGSDGNDVIIGSDFPEFIDAGYGDDTLTGNGGNDLLVGGPDNDLLREVAYVDQTDGQISTITLTDESLVLKRLGTTVSSDLLEEIERVDLSGGPLRDLLDATGFTSPLGVTISGGGGNDTVLGTNAADLILTLAGADSIQGNEGNDTIVSGGGNDIVRGGAGDDNLNGQAGNDSVFGDDGVDTIVGGAGVDTLNGGADNDFLSGQADRGVLNGGDGNDTLQGNSLNDTLNGDAGDDRLLALQGDDVLDGGDGADTLFGSTGHDTLNGGAGADDLRGELGSDSIDGGAGMDRLNEVFDTNVTISGALTAATVSILGGDTDSIRNVDRINLIGGPSRNFFDARNAGLPVLLSGEGGNDTLLGGSSSDIISGGSGDDVLSGGAGNDLIDGGAGTDHVSEKADTSFAVIDVTITSQATGSDTPTGAERIVLVGGPGSNKLDASLASISVILIGGSGNDTLLGGSSADTLTGGQRTDATVVGGDGVDSLNGGAGIDTIENDPADAIIPGVGDISIADVFTLLPGWIDAL